ncbi:MULTISPECIES: DUF2326 domain-containing protein [Bradyrhizobium]|uniref:DUF2326 domain-containing protein n=1 Tax=Bradyrhizobium TaxID=374 RepID=UPI00155E6D32|nr:MULTISPECIES: DUF2326 domain-containing protein [Bradyrhizobium]
MNIILADRAEDSEETESTNGLGKSTFVRIVHFCLGSDFAREKVLNHPELKGATFFLDFVWNALNCTVSRSTVREKHVRVTSNFLVGLDIETVDVGSGVSEISLDAWKVALAERYYPEAAVGEMKFSPSFRDLAVYLLRLGKSAFVDPQNAFQNQSGASKRLCTSFLLRLNWGKQREIESQIQARDRNKAAIEAFKTAEESQATLSIGDLEARRVASELLLRKKKEEVESFNVRSDYKDLEEALHALDRRLHDQVNQNFSDRRLLDYYRESARALPEIDPERPLAILRDAGAVFKEEALRTIDAVSKFHRDVYRNREEFLSGEIKRLSAEIERRTAEIDRISVEKTRLLRILNSSGAIETLIELQRSYADLNAQHEVLVSKIDERKKFDRLDDELAVSISRLKALLKTDLDDRRQAVDEVRALFAEYTSALYGVPGRLSVDVGKAGYRFSFVIDREGSDGVGQMVVFCFDLAVATIWAKLKKGLGTLVHDSTLFADVDPRQVASALNLASQKSREFGFQYICCLNSGLVSGKDFNFKVDPFVRIRLTDDSPKGRLLGMRLRPREQEDFQS